MHRYNRGTEEKPKTNRYRCSVLLHGEKTHSCVRAHCAQLLNLHPMKTGGKTGKSNSFNLFGHPPDRVALSASDVPFLEGLTPLEHVFIIMLPLVFLRDKKVMTNDD